ncbi:hypothetical protein D9M68_861060 [compost metagenome]
MGVNSKHLATFILGAAAGVALNKYLNSEDGEKMVESLKEKGNQLKSEAESAVDKAPQYFEDLKAGANEKFNEIVGNLKEKYPDAEKMLNELFAGFSKPKNEPGTGAEEEKA